MIENLKYKAMLRSELAEKAGVSPRTFRRWLVRELPHIALLDYNEDDKILPPQIVKYFCEKYIIYLD
jgi:hypothetical protein